MKIFRALTTLSLLLAALLLSSAAQAETWVCSSPSPDGGSFLSTYVRQGAEFSYTLTTPANQEYKSMTIESQPFEILDETNVMLMLVGISRDRDGLAIVMINKITKQEVNNAIQFYGDTVREEGSCVRI